MSFLAGRSHIVLSTKTPFRRISTLLLQHRPPHYFTKTASHFTAMAHDNHDDPALRAALEASMRGQTTPQTDFVDLTGDSDDESKFHTTPENIIDLEDEEIDDDLKLAIALSMQEMQQSPPSGVLNGHDSGVTGGTATDNDKPTHVSPTLEHQPVTVRPPAVNFGIPGLDRKRLEEERLARVAKRKAESSISPPPLKRDSKLAKREVSPDRGSEPKLTKGLPTTSAQALASPKKSVASRASTPESKPKTAQPSSTPSPQFPKGVVKKTWAFGYSRDGDDIKIEEVLQTADLELAILSAFQWDMEWMFSKFRTPRKTRFMLVMQAKEESTVSISFGLTRCETNNMIETTISRANGRYVQHSVMLSTYGRTG